MVDLTFDPHTLRASTTSSADSCRYSVDERWEIPHFEKMLYDNAQLLPLAGAPRVRNRANR